MILRKYMCLILLSCTLALKLSGQDRIPFYEDYIKDSNLEGFLDKAEEFLDKSADSPEAPRVTMDYLMVGKASSQSEVVEKATSLLLFRYPKSLPGLQFISSFDLGSPRLINLLISKADQADLKNKEFAVSFCRTLIFVARIQGPELLKNTSLRLRAFLLANLADVDEVSKVTLSSLKQLSKNKDAFGKVVGVILSDKTNFEKVQALSLISGNDSKFSLKYYLSQLDEKELNSEKVTIFKINQILYDRQPNTGSARKLIDSLSDKTKQMPLIRTLLAFSHHLDKNTNKAISLLKDSAQSESNRQSFLGSYANGLAALENRKKLFTEAIGKAIALFQKGGDHLFIKANWDSLEANGSIVNYDLFVRVSQADQEFETHLLKSGQPYVAYQSNNGSSSLLLPNSEKRIDFAETGALPLPSILIKRDAETGFFNYNFNLSFGSSFDDLIKAGNAFVDNPYFATLKGREVFWNYIMEKKLIWQGPPSSASSTTKFPIFSISKGDLNPRDSHFSFGLEGDLESFATGSFKISEIKLGRESMKQLLPDWPKLKVENKPNFDTELFMKVVNAISSAAQN